MPYLQRLRTILQSKKFVLVSLIFIILYVLIFTKLITYESKIPKNTSEFTGKIISYNIDGNKLSMIIDGNEKVVSTYYIDTLEEKNNLEESLLVGAIVTIKGSVSTPLNNTIRFRHNMQNPINPM